MTAPSLLLVSAMAVAAVACGGSQAAPSPAATSPTSPTPTATGPAPAPPPPPSTWDLDARGVPTFITHNYLDVGAIRQISRFRSGEGHSYTDDFETCRSMKHYFVPRGSTGWETIRIQAPVTGTIAYARAESNNLGTQIGITPADYPAFTVILFHVAPTMPLPDGASVEAGQPIGTHIGTQTWSDVTIRVQTPRGTALVSWFDALTESALAAYTSRGLASRAAAIISRSERDANPLGCNGETFANRGTIENWVELGR